MAGSEVKLYPYRWVVLAAFMLINVMVQVLWICYAPVASIAATAYGVQRADVDLLANLFLLIYIPIAFPAAWAIDTFGFKKAVGFGAILMAVFGILRGGVSAELYGRAHRLHRHLDRSAVSPERLHEAGRGMVSAEAARNHHRRRYSFRCFSGSASARP